MYSSLFVLFSVLSCHTVAAGWSFKEFLAGEWTLERHRGESTTQATYALSVVDGHLEGFYYEFGSDGDAERTNERRVLVDFSDGEERKGSFQLAKLRDAGWEEELSSQQPDLRPVFEFDFSSHLNEKFWLSETRWLGANGGRLQFVTIDEDSFIISHFAAAKSSDAATVAVSTWTATRKGSLPRRAATHAGTSKPKSLLSRYWKLLLGAIVLVGYRVFKQNKAQFAGGRKK